MTVPDGLYLIVDGKPVLVGMAMLVSWMAEDPEAPKDKDWFTAENILLGADRTAALKGLAG